MKINWKSWKTWAAGVLLLVLVLVAADATYFYIYGPVRHMSPKEIADFKEDAEHGDYETGGKLAYYYEHGWAGVKQDYAEAYFQNSIAAVQTTEPETTAARQHAAEDAEHLTPAEKADADKRVAKWIKEHPALASKR